MIIGVVNQKGGVGKSTTSINVSAELARRGNRVMLLDTDIQGSCLDWQAARDNAGFERLVSCFALPRATIHKEVPHMAKDYDYIVIDGVPRNDEVIGSIVMASDVAIIPMTPSPLDLWSAASTAKLIERALVYKPNLQIFFLMNALVKKTIIAATLETALDDQPYATLDTALHQWVIMAESLINGQVPFEIEGLRGAAALEITNLTNEILKKGEQQ